MNKTTNHNIVNKNLISTSLWYTAPYQIELRNQQLPDQCRTNHLRIKALYSAISKGTERLVYSDLIPKSEWSRMQCPFQVGDFPFPVKYGYSMVGKVIQDKSYLNGQNVLSSTRMNLYLIFLKIQFYQSPKISQQNERYLQPIWKLH